MSQLETRLEQLRQQMMLGQNRLAVLDAEAAKLRQEMLRIAGAIQVLEEVVGSEAGGDPQAN